MGSSEVQEYLDQLTHPRQREIAALRAAILASDDGFSESVKWNAPNFIYAGVDRVTFRLQPRDQFQVILHRGSKKSAGPVPSFASDSALVTWIAPDRGVIDVPSGADLDNQMDALVGVIGAWARS
jgi:hypothetical protein